MEDTGETVYPSQLRNDGGLNGEGGDQVTLGARGQQRMEYRRPAMVQSPHLEGGHGREEHGVSADLPEGSVLPFFARHEHAFQHELSPGRDGEPGKGGRHDLQGLLSQPARIGHLLRTRRRGQSRRHEGGRLQPHRDGHRHLHVPPVSPIGVGQWRVDERHTETVAPAQFHAADRAFHRAGIGVEHARHTRGEVRSGVGLVVREDGQEPEIDVVEGHLQDRSIRH